MTRGHTEASHRQTGQNRGHCNMLVYSGDISNIPSKVVHIPASFVAVPFSLVGVPMYQPLEMISIVSPDNNSKHYSGHHHLLTQTN